MCVFWYCREFGCTLDLNVWVGVAYVSQHIVCLPITSANLCNMSVLIRMCWYGGRAQGERSIQPFCILPDVHSDSLACLFCLIRGDILFLLLRHTWEIMSRRKITYFVYNSVTSKMGRGLLRDPAECCLNRFKQREHTVELMIRKGNAPGSYFKRSMSGSWNRHTLDFTVKRGRHLRYMNEYLRCHKG